MKSPEEQEREENRKDGAFERREKKRKLTIAEKKQAKSNNVPLAVVDFRRKKGWPIGSAINTPYTKPHKSEEESH